MRILITTGGTGGHVFPAVALAQALQAQEDDVAIISDARGLALVPLTIPTHRIAAASPQKTGAAAKLKAGGHLSQGLLQTLALLRRQRPKVIISFGSYASVPVVIAANILKIPLILHEQNAVLGLAHRVASHWAKYVALSFAATSRIPKRALKKIVVTGNPVRAEIAALANQPYQPPQADGPIELLITSGSLGAKIFGEVLPAACQELPMALRSRLRITQQCRADSLAATQQAYDELQMQLVLAPFFTDLGTRMAKAQLIICRAGASTVAEILTLGRPAIYIPLPAAADDHQTANAKIVAAADAGWHLPQHDFTPQHLAKLLSELLTDPAQLTAAAAQAKTIMAAAGCEKLLALVNHFTRS